MKELDNIAAFGAFFDFLENPSKYKKIIEDAEKASKEAKDTIEKQRKIKDVDKWRASESARLDRRDKEVEHNSSVLAKKLLDFNSAVELHKQQSADTSRQLTNRSKSLDERENAVANIEKERDKLKKLQQESIDERLKLQQERDKLKQREAQIKAAIGGS